jgi:hypothetical protein
MNKAVITPFLSKRLLGLLFSRTKKLRKLKDDSFNSLTSWFSRDTAKYTSALKGTK